MAPITRGRRDNVISYVVSPIVSICGERGSEVRVFGLKRPEKRESGLRPQKALLPTGLGTASAA
jgi:hypothetical protein